MKKREKEFLKFLNEFLISKRVDAWDNECSSIAYRSEQMKYNLWDLVDEIEIPKLNQKFELRSLSSRLMFILGEWVDDVRKTKLGDEKIKLFKSIFEIKFRQINNTEKKFVYNNLVSVEEIYVLKEYNHCEIETIMYKYFVEKIVNDQTKVPFHILGGRSRYFGYEKLWEILSHSSNIIVDIIDLKNKEVLETDVVLRQGKQDDDFDKKTLFYEDDKDYLRTVLKGRVDK